ncbi:MAG: cold shock domain-containing protein [Planctomycetes bacterium]|nr:cold shock domain-containing protein [Planctomycetota bacterium]
MSRLSGKITKLVDASGYGFIARDNDTDRKDYFFSVHSLGPGVDFYELRPGGRVTFEHQDSPKGKRAAKIERETR